MQIDDQFGGQSADDKPIDLQPVDLSMLLLKELGVKWIVEAFDYLADNSAMIVNGFLQSGIFKALYGKDMAALIATKMKTFILMKMRKRMSITVGARTNS